MQFGNLLSFTLIFVIVSFTISLALMYLNPKFRLSKFTFWKRVVIGNIISAIVVYYISSYFNIYFY